MTAPTQNVTPNMGEEETAKAPIGLIILVVALGIAILGMLALMAYKIMSGDASKSKKVPVVATEQVATIVSGFDELTVTKPEGSTLSKIETSDGTVTLHYKSEASVTLILIDRVSGKESRVIIPE